MAKDPQKSGSREIGPRYSDPFGMFRAEMDRLLDTFLGSGLPTFPSLFSSGMSRSSMLAPRIDVKETDKGIIIAAEALGQTRRTFR
jgi:hypothetical protein